MRPAEVFGLKAKPCELEQRLGRERGARVLGDYLIVIARGFFVSAVVLVYAGEEEARLRRPFSFSCLLEQAMRLFFEGGLVFFAQVISAQIIPRLRAPGVTGGVVFDGVSEGGVRLFRFAQGKERERFVESDAFVVGGLGKQALQIPKASQRLFEMIPFSQEAGAFVVGLWSRFFERWREGGADSQRAS